MYVKFSQASFSIGMDIAPLSDTTITGQSGYEPVYVNSVTYGRMGIIVFETDETYEFAESCIKKEFERIFYHKTTTLTKEEELFFETTDFKILIIGADSDYAVQTIKGYSYFLNMIYNSKFTEHSYGVPIRCTFAYANSHELVETEFTNVLYIDPLFVSYQKLNSDYYENTEYGDYYYSSDIFMYFYKDREKTKTATPNSELIFTINKYQSEAVYQPDYDRWPMIYMTTLNDNEVIKWQNTNQATSKYVGKEYSYRESTGPGPQMGDIIYQWRAVENSCHYTLAESPFFLIIN